MTLDLFSDVFSALEDGAFEERPVDVRTFVESSEYLNHPPLSDLQYLAVECMSQIYREQELITLLGVQDAAEYFRKYTKTEIILMLGKGTTIGSTKSWSPEFGWKRIDEKLEDYGLIQSLNFSHGATAFYSEGEDDVFKVTTRSGYTFTGNAGHKMYGWKDKKHGLAYSTRGPIEELSVAELSVGDIAAIYGNWDEPENPYEISDDEARLIGYMLGDGSFVKNGGHGHNNPCFTNSTPEVQEDVLRIVESLGGSVKHYESGAGCWAIRINGLNEWFVRHGLVHDYYEKKPWNDNWMNMSRSALSALVNGFWATDGWGHVQRHNGGTSLHVSIETNSESLMSGLHMALLRLGVKSSFRNNRKLRNDGKHNPTWRISITNSADIVAFQDSVGVPVGKDAVFNEIFELAKEFSVTNTHGVFRDRIASITYEGKQEVFATTVETGHNYLGNGFIHGNSGKDLTATIAVSFIVYKLLCLTDPARYYGKPSGDAIDIINIAINAQQAKNVFFKGFLNKINKSKWFKGKYEAKADSVEFGKGITVYSGHSERESHEGLNIFCAVLDEISGFAMDSVTGHANAKTGDAIYKAFRGTVDSRFSDYGKVILLSFPRRKDCFISQKYEEAIAERVTKVRTHKFKLHEDMPDGVEGNEFEIEWDEDHITKYNLPKVFALKRPTWEVNPTRDIEDFKNAFYSDEVDALQRFACVEENEIIATEKGSVAIKNVNPGDIIQSQHGPTKVTNVWFQEKECIKITLKTGQSVTCTKDHGLLRVNSIRRGAGVARRLGRYREEWLEAGRLSVGDKLRTSYVENISQEPTLGETRAYLLGLILTDGWIRSDTRSYIGIACGTSLEYANAVKDKFDQVSFGCATVRKRKPDPKLSDKTQYSVHVTQPEIVKQFISLGLSRTPAQEKTLPPVVWSMPSNEFWAFMSGFIDGDGSFGRQGVITLVSTSKQMLKDLQVVLAFNQIRSNLWINRKASSSGKIKSVYDLWGLRLNLYSATVLGQKLSLLSDKRYANVQDKFVQKGKGESEKEYSEIVSIENVGVKTVVDITTKNHEFVANGIVVHNCKAPDAANDDYFKDHALLAESFSQLPAIVEGQSFQPWFEPDPDKQYFMHVDLAQKHDRCAIALCHVVGWDVSTTIPNSDWAAPMLQVDMVYWWTPTKDKSVDFNDVRGMILGLRTRGFNIKLVTFDRWGSHDMMQELQALGVVTEVLSVAKKHYDDFKVALQDRRIVGPSIDIMLEEFKQLQVVRGDKIDHRRSGSKDLADAVVGAVFNASTRTPKGSTEITEIRTLADRNRKEVTESKNVIKAPPGTKMPEALSDYLSYIRTL